jgi:hypothetical protein
VSLLREGIEDYFRYLSDEEQNNMPVQILNPKDSTLQKKMAWEINVGDVVKLE